MPVEIPNPWNHFLLDVNRALSQPIEVHCLGGFGLVVLWGFPRPTGDIDFIEVAPKEGFRELLEIAGADSDLARRHGLHFHSATVAEFPERYASRLIEMTSPGFSKLHLLGLEVYDLVLAKLGRNIAKDRSDVEFLAEKGVLDRRILEERFEAELRPYVLNPERHKDALDLWVIQYFRRRH